MKKLMAFMMAGVMFFGASPVTAFAAGNDTAETQNTVTVEEKTQDADKEAEETVKEQLEMKQDKDGNIVFSFGDWEWTVPKDTKVKTGTVVDMNSYLHLRSGAGMKYNIIGHLLPGAEVEVIGEEGDWYKVTVPEQSGYVHGDYLKVIEEAKNGEVNEDSLAMVLYMMMQSMNDNTSGVSLTPDGNLTLVDDIGSSKKAGQQFITFVSKNGNTFYMIIDRNDKGEENVHFLNLVDERDLLALMEEEEAAQYQKPEKPVEEPVVEQPTEVEDEKEEEPEKKKSTPVLPLMLLFLVGAGGVGGFLYIKMKDKKKATSIEAVDPDADYQDEDDDAYEIPDEDEENDEEEEYEEYDDEVEE